MMNFFKMNLLWAHLPANLHSIVAQKDHTDNAIKKMYKIATTSQCESKDSRKTNPTNEVTWEEQNYDSQENTDAAAFGSDRWHKAQGRKTWALCSRGVTAIVKDKTEETNKDQLQEVQTRNNTNRNGKYCY
jgi:hypothetical protein